MIDYKLLLMKVLRCFGEQEGTCFENQWKHYGISEEDKELILKELAMYENSLHS